MSEAYYPPGARYDVRAPYNQHENDEHEFNIVISQSLSKETTVWSKDYIHEQDEETGYCSDDTSEINWSKEYDEQHYTPLELISEFKKVLEEHIANYEKYHDTHDLLAKRDRTIYKYQNLIKECEGWVEDDFSVSMY